MRWFLPLAAALLLGLAGGALLGGCGGSGTKTVSVAATPAQTASSAGGTSTGTGTTAGTPSTPAAGGATQAPATTRSAPEPAFTETATGREGSAAVATAAAVVRAHGYTPNDTSQYRTGQTLGVLVGTRTGSGDGYGQQAFFFVNGRYIGTDASEPSATLRVVSQSDTEATLAYPLYRRNDPLCCPGGGQANVRFQLNNGRLQALDPIPPAHSASGLSRF